MIPVPALFSPCPGLIAPAAAASIERISATLQGFSGGGYL